MTKGTLYGVGIGPGDPELLTLKALNCIRQADLVILPGSVAEETTAYKIVIQVYPELAEKELVACDMPMTHNLEALARSHRQAADTIESYLEQGKNAAFLTLGDPTIYSTYLYVHRMVTEDGYPTAIISGVPSFCAAAARLNTGLVERSDLLHVIPGAYNRLEALEDRGTKVLMKSGRQFEKIRKDLEESGQEVMMVENCGMPDEKVYHSMEEIPHDAGYFTLVIVKEKKE